MSGFFHAVMGKRQGLVGSLIFYIFCTSKLVCYQGNYADTFQVSVHLMLTSAKHVLKKYITMVIH